MITSDQGIPNRCESLGVKPKQGIIGESTKIYVENIVALKAIIKKMFYGKFVVER